MKERRKKKKERERERERKKKKKKKEEEEEEKLTSGLYLSDFRVYTTIYVREAASGKSLSAYDILRNETKRNETKQIFKGLFIEKKIFFFFSLNLS